MKEYISNTMNKKRFILLAITVTFITALYWLASHSYIEITVKKSGSGSLTYRVLDQKAQKTAEIKSPESKIKKLVRRGSHEVLISGDGASYFTVAKTGGFLATKHVVAEMLPEKGREFRGDSPDPCAHYISTVLISFGCGGKFENTKVHVPASNETPTYTAQTLESIGQGFVEGMVDTAEGAVVIIKAPASTDVFAEHTAYLVRFENNQLSLHDEVPLLDLKDNKFYSTVAYKTGFLVYDNSFEQILYYSDRRAKPVPINIDRSSENTLKPYALSIRKNILALSLSNNTEGEVADLHDDSPRVQTEVAIFDGNKTTTFNLKGQYRSALLCGNDKLCLLRAKSLEVHDISGTNSRLIYKVSDVENISSSESNLTVFRSGEVLGLDVDKINGSIEYSLGGYTFCGLLHYNDSGYTLCLINSRQKRVALAITEQPLSLTGKIDKQILNLLETKEIKEVSIYGRFIHISPELGEVVYDEASQSFGYDPATIVKVNALIDQAINNQGINTNYYQIINPFK